MERRTRGPGARVGSGAVPRADDIHTIPDNLPVPEDDGAADHLLNVVIPAIALTATTGERIRLDELDGRTVLFCCPVFPPDSHAREVLDALSR